jgi:hypothetical protein
MTKWDFGSGKGVTGTGYRVPVVNRGHHCIGWQSGKFAQALQEAIMVDAAQ